MSSGAAMPPSAAPVTGLGAGRTGADGSLIDPKVLMSIRNLELRARVVVEGFWSGLHRSPYHGFSVEFTEYRQYTPGDDPRYLDWRVYARSDRYFVKRFEDETNLRCHLIVDQSRSMSYGSPGYAKAEYAATLAATLACFLDLQGDAIGLLTFDEAVRDYLPPRHRIGHLRRLMLALERPAAGHGTDLTAPLARVTELVRKRGLVVLISDFLAPLERLAPALTQLCARGHEVAVFHLQDPAEVTFPFREPAQFEDVESGTTLTLDPVTARTEYQRRVTGHVSAVQQLCERLGASHARLATDQALEFALFDFLRRRLQRKRLRRRPAQRFGPQPRA
jgi:uncharacterized protein (DUF58 family)